MKIKHDAQGPRFEHECDDCKPGINWQIDPIESDGRATGDVQIWADVPEATAAFICRAVNCHDDLIMCKEMLIHACMDLENFYNTPDENNMVTAPDSVFRAKLALYKKAIAQVEGK